MNQYTGIAYKNDPTIFMIELGNELGNIRPDALSLAIPTQEVNIIILIGIDFKVDCGYICIY